MGTTSGFLLSSDFKVVTKDTEVGGFNRIEGKLTTKFYVLQIQASSPNKQHKKTISRKRKKSCCTTLNSSQKGSDKILKVAKTNKTCGSKTKRNKEKTVEAN